MTLHWELNKREVYASFENNNYKYTQLLRMMIILNINGYILLWNLLPFTKNQQEVHTFTIYMNFYVYYSV
jgi:hypothetical protein